MSLDKLLTDILKTEYYHRHNRESGCMFHENMPYPCDRERIPLVMGPVHKATVAMLNLEYGGVVSASLRKRLQLNPTALEVYHNTEGLVAIFYPSIWSEKLKSAIEQELTHWITEDSRRAF